MDKEKARPSPRAFLSYASEDSDLAKRIATALANHGIDTWWDKWEIRAGDSFIQKINKGLGDCTHFIVLLTPLSISKPWVEAEIYAAFVRRMANTVTFIPLRCDLPAERLPPLLRGFHSPEINDAGLTETVAQVANDINSVTRKPAISSAPTVLDLPDTSYSPAAMAVADYFCRTTSNAARFDPLVTVGELSGATGLTLEDAIDALHELRSFVDQTKKTGLEEDINVWPKPRFWPEFDRYFDVNPDPRGDAVTIAACLQNDLGFPDRPAQIAAQLDWRPRRLNPALAYLMDREIVRHGYTLGEKFWIVTIIKRTNDTRRFVKRQT